MALTECRECGNKISNQAPTCPKCGAPRAAAAAATVPERGWLAKMFSPKIRCTNCGYLGAPDTVGWDASGCLIAIILLAAFLIPGIIYILWRMSRASQVCCPKCKFEKVVEV